MFVLFWPCNVETGILFCSSKFSGPQSSSGFILLLLSLSSTWTSWQAVVKYWIFWAVVRKLIICRLNCVYKCLQDYSFLFFSPVVCLVRFKDTAIVPCDFGVYVDSRWSPWRTLLKLEKKWIQVLPSFHVPGDKIMMSWFALWPWPSAWEIQ